MAPGPDTTAEAGSSRPAAHPGTGDTRPHHRPPSAGPEPGARTGGDTGAEADAAMNSGQTTGAEPPARPGRTRRALRAARRHAPRTGLAVVAGLALAAAFPPYGAWPLSVLAVAALSLLARGGTARRGAWLGLALGLPFFFGLLQWLHVVGWDAVAGLALLEALFFVPLGAGLAATSRLPLWPLWAGCLWVAEEWARDRIPFGGFPWGRLAFANTDSPYTPLAALGGAPLVTFAVALTGALLAAAVTAVAGAVAARRPRGTRSGAAGPDGSEPDGSEPDGTGPDGPRTGRRLRSGPWPAVAAAGGTAGLAAAVTLAGYAVPVPTEADDTVDIAVVQGNVQQPGMDFLGRPMLILTNHVEATLDLAADVDAGRVPRPDLVIWPENASDLDPYRHPGAREAIERAVAAIDVPVLVGALVDHPEKDGYVQNQGIVWSPETGPGASYTKQHPVPFGEYVPFREQLSKVISRLDRVPRDFYPGGSTGVLDVGPARLGDVICFEVAYDEIVRDTVNDGARALVVQTNNATYGRTGQPEQQLAMSSLRAVEHGRAVVTAAPSGISAVVAPDGTVEQRTDEFTRQVITATLPLRDDITLADRFGSRPEWALAIVGVLSCAVAYILGRGGRKDEEGQQQ